MALRIWASFDSVAESGREIVFESPDWSFVTTNARARARALDTNLANRLRVLAFRCVIVRKRIRREYARFPLVKLLFRGRNRQN